MVLATRGPSCTVRLVPSLRTANISLWVFMSPAPKPSLYVVPQCHRQGLDRRSGSYEMGVFAWYTYMSGSEMMHSLESRERVCSIRVSTPKNTSQMRHCRLIQPPKEALEREHIQNHSLIPCPRTFTCCLLLTANDLNLYAREKKGFLVLPSPTGMSNRRPYI